MSDPWAFGWTQVLAIAALVLTSVVSWLGLRTFGKWRRETIEGRRIEVAVEALSLTYQSKWIFENIRAPIVYEYEYDDMAGISGESDDERARRGKYFGVMRRIERNSEFFKEVWRVQPRVMALFGADTEAIFREMHEARRQMEVSAGLLFQHFREERHKQLTEDTKRLRHEQLEDIDWAEASGGKKGDRIGAKLAAFREKMEKLCRPIVERGYRE
ncbi:MAG: hypothetical protein ACLP0B_16850 [Steroidobacteraceae bacterium]|jgi:hypothetical protein